MTDPLDDDLRDILEGQRDLLAWITAAPASLEDRLARLRQLESSGLLAQVCDLSDLQAQVMLSRYRTTLVGRLLSLATADGAPPEFARRALVDLLKLDLRPKGAGRDDEAPEDLEKTFAPLINAIHADPEPDA